MPVFVCGLDLSRRFFREAVRPLLAPAFPNLHYAAALLGPGSEVLGFDTEMSADHDWGPRLFLFLREEDAEQGDMIGNLLSQQLPETFADFPVSFPTPVSPKMRSMTRPLAGPVSLWLERSIMTTLANSLRYAPVLDGIPMTSGSTCWPLAGSVLVRRNI